MSAALLLLLSSPSPSSLHVVVILMVTYLTVYVFSSVLQEALPFSVSHLFTGVYVAYQASQVSFW